jgi:hypothetical protein
MSITVESVLEDTLYCIKEHVAGHLSSYLEAMVDLKEDGIDLPDIKVHVVGDMDALKQNRFPMAFYYPTEITVSPLDLGEDEISIQVFVSVILKGADGDKLTTMALRYTDCLRQMVNADHTMGGACDFARVSKVGYFASEPGSDNLMEIETTLSVTITVDN